MILVDTSVWGAAVSSSTTRRSLAAHLEEGEVLAHAWVIGELSLVDLGPKGAHYIEMLRLLPRAPALRDDDVLALVKGRRLAGRGIGWVDAHLLGSTLACGARLWTVDRRLARLAGELGAAHRPS